MTTSSTMGNLIRDNVLHQMKLGSWSIRRLASTPGGPRTPFSHRLEDQSGMTMNELAALGYAHGCGPTALVTEIAR